MTSDQFGKVLMAGTLAGLIYGVMPLRAWQRIGLILWCMVLNVIGQKLGVW